MTNSPKPPLHNLPSPPGNARLRLDSSQLLQGAQAVEIEHAGQCYLLRVTRENKLILTK